MIQDCTWQNWNGVSDSAVDAERGGADILYASSELK